MSVALVVTFDSVSDARIRRFWAALEAPGLVETNTGRPHLTVALIDPGDLERAGDALAEAASGLHGTTIAFESLGVFPGERPVLFLNPIVNGGLLAMHRRIHDALRKAGISGTGPSQHQIPGKWVPHVTLGHLHDPAGLGDAVAIANRFRLRFDVTCIGLSAMSADPV